MGTIRIEIGGRTSTFEEQSVLRVGREPGSEVMVDAPTVSRNHAEFRAAGDGWEIVDLGSTHGTWVNGRKVDRMLLPAGTTIVRFGLTDGGASAQATVEGAAPPGAPDRPGAGATAAVPPAAMAPTVLPSTPGAPGIPGGGPGLLVRTNRDDLRFGTHAPVRIGREPGLEVVVDDSGVSRQHALVEPRPDGWWFLDRSNSGSYVDGERVTQLKLEDPTTTVLLGHPTAGYEIELVPVLAAGAASAQIARRKRRKTLAVMGAALAVLLVVGGGVAAAVLLGGDDDDPSSSAGDGGGDNNDADLTPAELDRAKQASVLILSLDEAGEVLGNGSGSIISEDGLILTNAHVAKPSAPGLGSEEEGDPASYQIALVGGEDDRPAAPEYVAETIVADGVLDLAIMQITADIDGNPVEAEDLDLPDPLPIADSDELRTGDEITALGFPGVAHVATTEDFERRALTVTRGVVSTFLQELPVDENRAWIDSDIRIGSGNSGGASINQSGEIVGINTAVVTEATVADSGEGGSFTGGSARIRPVNFAQDLIEIAEDGGDPNYVSPLLEEMSPPPTEMPAAVEVVSAGWTGDGQGGCTGTSSPDAPQEYAVPNAGQVINAEFAVTGIEDGTPVNFDFYALDGQTLLSSGEQVWAFGPDEVCIFVPFEVPEGANGANAVFRVGDQVLAENPVVFVKP
ncbi:MAG TPA: FHA domain-containing protein [Nocardioides sp.]|nr:FHA domain-containing protein [Nocardioides sp.]